MGRRKTPPVTVADGASEDVAAAAVAEAAAKAAAVAAVAATAAERRRLWFAAAKPPMYTVAVTPMLVGTAAAYAATGAYSASRLGTLLAAAVAIVAWLNITNDVFDAATGIDVHKAESLVNLLGGTPRVRRQLLVAATTLLAAAAAGLASLCVTPGGAAFDPTLLVVMGTAVALGYAYQGPPFRLGYYGLGEPITLVAWTLAVGAAYYTQLPPPPPPSRGSGWVLPPVAIADRLTSLAEAYVTPAAGLGVPALLVALPTALILLCSHLHQGADDAAAGKRSPVVRFGTRGVAGGVIAGVASMYLLQVGAWAVGGEGGDGRWLPSTAAASAVVSVPLAVRLVVFVGRWHAVPAVIRPAKYVAVRLHAVHGLALAAGLAASRSPYWASRF
ncbi:hypothetical protein MMPV_007972 [Pyropia vietnamensis]